MQVLCNKCISNDSLCYYIYILYFYSYIMCFYLMQPGPYLGGDSNQGLLPPAAALSREW